MFLPVNSFVSLAIVLEFIFYFHVLAEVHVCNVGKIFLSLHNFSLFVGGCAVSEDILRQCIERALHRGHEIRKIIDTLTATIDR